MTAIEQLYQVRCNTPHNIDQHLPTIRRYAALCDHVTEFGVERGWSTSALLASGAAHVRSYDIVRHPDLEDVEKAVNDTPGTDWRFILGDTRQVRIEPTDLLFVDTDHTYDQVYRELELNVGRVKRFLLFHDTVSSPEIIPAILSFTYGEWTLRTWAVHQNGLAVFERVRQ